MDYDHMYNDAISQEKKAVGLASLVILIVACLFFFAAIVLKEPILGIEVKTLKNVLMLTAVIVMVGGFLPKLFLKKQEIQY